MSRRWRYPFIRRGKFFDYPEQLPPPPWDAAPPIGRYNRFGLRVRRGQFLWVPPTPVAPPAAPAYPPGIIRQAIRRVLFLGRSSRYDPPWTQATQPPTPLTVRRRTTGLARRGEYLWVPPPPPVASGTGPLIQPPYRESIRRGFLARRGRYWYVPLVGGAPLTPATWPPPVITARRHRTYPTRRHATFPVPVPQSQPTPFQTCRPIARRVRPTRRGQFFQPPWPQVVTAPPTYPPQRVVARRRPIPRPRGMHCRFFEPGWPQAIQVGINDANGRVVVTQTTSSTVVGSSTAGGLVDITQTVSSSGFASSAAGGATSVDPTSDGRAEVG